MQNYALHYDYNENKYDLIILFKNKTFNRVGKFDENIFKRRHPFPFKRND